MISSDHLKPGEAGQIKASVETSGRSGRMEKFVTVYSNDRKNPELTLIIGAEVVEK